MCGFMPQLNDSEIFPMIASSRTALLGTFLFFAIGEFLSTTVGAVAPLWGFLSPLQWIASLVVVMTGQAPMAEQILQTATYAGHGAVSCLTAAVMSGLMGLAVVVSVEFILTHAYRSSTLGGKLFVLTFMPIWVFLALYYPMWKTFPSFQTAVWPLESQAYEIRLGTGFGIMLMAVITPMLVLLCTKVLLLIVHPERSYTSSD